MNVILYGDKDVNSLIETLENKLKLFNSDFNIKKTLKNELLKIAKKDLRLRFVKNKKFHIWIEDATEAGVDYYIEKYSNCKSPNFLQYYNKFLNRLYYCKNNLLDYSITLTEEELAINQYNWLENQLKEFIKSSISHYKLLQQW